ncbi:1-acyl-sn-glycerol-3-phosphate acyltransferase [Angulomicrobium tetraedrale]|uniref:1-acyl-sn-glycerol-3-phosphate acyltransferase n=1 Tax=Ancylobacter tetraedralis TaxID=217068 RepID=A0A839Z4Z7_9HYPH|nr:lysophospholipid acyltransferase family protein [Ancylobacter tetraedralis]MBB3770722.1 1-acyl-sn-glycerol-3-phosphate acyltransferase [Ancylobacter tetraedralis]
MRAGGLRVGLVLVPVVLVTLIGIPLQWLAVRYRLPARRTLPLLYHRIVLALVGVRVRVVGAPATARPLLLVSNHVSWLDICVLGSCLPLCFVAKAEVAGWPGIGLLAKLQRTIFVDRTSRAATGKVAGEMAARMNDGDPVVLFAEGTSSDGNRVLQFRSALIGAARATLGEGAAAGDAAGAAILQPLAIAYVRQNGVPLGRAGRPRLAWYGDMDLAPHLLAVLRRGAVDVEVHFGAPLDAGDRKAATLRAEAASRTMLARALTGR